MEWNYIIFLFLFVCVCVYCQAFCHKFCLFIFLLFKSAAKDSSSGDFSSFIGCMKDLKYSGRDIPIDVAEGVSAGCIDRCQEKGRCINSGRCVNLYTDFHCDCFGTDFEGASCAKQGIRLFHYSSFLVSLHLRIFCSSPIGIF